LACTARIRRNQAKQSPHFTPRNIARLLGLPDYPFLTVQHPIGSCTLPELKARAEIAYTQALPILLHA